LISKHLFIMNLVVMNRFVVGLVVNALVNTLVDAMAPVSA